MIVKTEDDSGTWDAVEVERIFVPYFDESICILAKNIMEEKGKQDSDYQSFIIFDRGKHTGLETKQEYLEILKSDFIWYIEDYFDGGYSKQISGRLVQRTGIISSIEVLLQKHHNKDFILLNLGFFGKILKYNSYTNYSKTHIDFESEIIHP